MKIVLLAGLSVFVLCGVASATVNEGMYCWVSESEFPVDCDGEE